MKQITRKHWAVIYPDGSAGLYPFNKKGKDEAENGINDDKDFIVEATLNYIRPPKHKCNCDECPKKNENS